MSKKQNNNQFERRNSYIFQVKYLKTHSDRVLNVSGYYCQVGFFWKRMHLKWDDGSQNQTPTWVISTNMDARCSCDSRKRTKSTLLSWTALHFVNTMISEKKCDWLVKKNKQTNKKRALQHRTELQAALVCTITIRCAAWGKKNNHCTPKKVNYETQCNSGKYKANNVITLRNL